MKKAQISVEYMIILSITIAMVIGGAVIFVTYTESSKNQVTKSQISGLGNQIIQNAESIYTIGNGSWIVIDVDYPKELVDIYIADKEELVFVLDTSEGISESIFFSDIALRGTTGSGNKERFGVVQPGKHSIKIESKGDAVLLNTS